MDERHREGVGLNKAVALHAEDPAVALVIFTLSRSAGRGGQYAIAGEFLEKYLGGRSLGDFAVALRRRETGAVRRLPVAGLLVAGSSPSGSLDMIAPSPCWASSAS